MDDTQLDNLLENEREWRRYVIERIERMAEDNHEISNQIAGIKVWSMVFRISGSALFAVLCIWIESKL